MVMRGVQWTGDTASVDAMIRSQIGSASKKNEHNAKASFYRSQEMGRADQPSPDASACNAP